MKNDMAAVECASNILQTMLREDSIREIRNPTSQMFDFKAYHKHEKVIPRRQYRKGNGFQTKEHWFNIVGMK